MTRRQLSKRRITVRLTDEQWRAIENFRLEIIMDSNGRQDMTISDVIDRWYQAWKSSHAAP